MNTYKKFENLSAGEIEMVKSVFALDVKGRRSMPRVINADRREKGKKEYCFKDYWTALGLYGEDKKQKREEKVFAKIGINIALFD